MITQPTEHTADRPTLSDQDSAFDTLVALAEAFGHLPAPYVTLHPTRSLCIGLQFDGPADFEQWRIALGIEASSVVLKEGPSLHWLTADGTFCGTAVRLTGHGVVLAAPRLVAA